MEQEFLIRQADLLDPEKAKRLRITVVGAGAIGSFATLTLAKMGFENITVYDGDNVDKENMNCQFFPPSYIGHNKATALGELVELFTRTKIKTVPRFFQDDEFVRGDVCLSCVDSMKVRNLIFSNCGARYLIDSRMAAEYISLYQVDMSDTKRVDEYKKTLYADGEAVSERCTAKSTMYTVNLIAGLIGKSVKDILVGHEKPITGLDWSVKANSAIWFSNGSKLTM